MESLNTVNQEPDDGVLTNMSDCADTHVNEGSFATSDASSFHQTIEDTSPAVEKCTTTPSLDPYSYVQRGDYTSEVYKLELMNLPRRFGIAVSRFSVCLLTASLLMC